MQPLEDILRQQDKLRPPYGECHHCHDTGHWIGLLIRSLHMDNVISVDLKIIGLQIVIREKKI